MNLSRNSASLNYDENSTLQTIFSIHMQTEKSKTKTQIENNANIDMQQGSMTLKIDNDTCWILTFIINVRTLH